MSVCPSVRLSIRTEQAGLHRTDFHEILYLSVFRKSVDKTQASLQSDSYNGTSHADRPTYEGWNFNSGNYLFTTDT